MIDNAICDMPIFINKHIFRHLELAFVSAIAASNE